MIGSRIVHRVGSASCGVVGGIGAKSVGVCVSMSATTIGATTVTLPRVEVPLPLTRHVVRTVVTAPTVDVPGPDKSRGEPALFTPGPLTTSARTKEAMLQDLGSRDVRFLGAISDVRNGLLEIAGVSQEDGYECVIVQGSGTFAVEATISSVVPREGAKILVVSNGAYGKRISAMCTVYDIPHTVLDFKEREPVTVEAVLKAFEADPDYTHVAMIHHETTTGALNPAHDVGLALHKSRPGTTYIVDSMSGFGAYPLNPKESHIDYLVSSSNKNIEGVPGFAYSIARRDALLGTRGNARTLSLDILGQWEGLEGNGQFRFTPPTHAILSFKQALTEHKAEGGWEGRLARYQHNFNVLKQGMAEMGFELFLDDSIQGCIISTFLWPDDPAFNFNDFYLSLGDRGIVIYPGKLTEADCFRIGSIGRLFEQDMKNCLDAIREVLLEQGVTLPVKQIKV